MSPGMGVPVVFRAWNPLRIPMMKPLPVGSEPCREGLMLIPNKFVVKVAKG